MEGLEPEATRSAHSRSDRPRSEQRLLEEVQRGRDPPPEGSRHPGGELRSGDREAVLRQGVRGGLGKHHQGEPAVRAADEEALQPLVRAYALLLQAFAYVAAVLVGAMALAVTLDVIGRTLGWSNTGWVGEVTEYSLPVATLLVAPYLLYRNEHVRLDVVLAIVPKRVSLFLERCADVLGMMICAIFVWYGIRLLFDSSRLGSMVVKTLAIPAWWQYALCPVWFALLALEFARRLRA